MTIETPRPGLEAARTRQAGPETVGWWRSKRCGVRPSTAAILSPLLLLMACESPNREPTQSVLGSSIKSDEDVVFFPTNAALVEGQWRIPVHGWIFEPEDDSSRRELVIKALGSGIDSLPASGSNALFEERMRFFLVDNERRKRLAVEAAGQSFLLSPSESNGHFRGEITTTGEAAHWVSYRAHGDDSRIFEGHARLLAPEGLSVISDIDDTIKVSEVLNKQRLAERTFLLPFEAVPGMASVYSAWQAQEAAAFHYVSASPWQLYTPLAEFVDGQDFPRGTIHLRDFRLKDSSGLEFIGPSRQYKVETITGLFESFPQRQFVLVGDSGEADPEVYAEIARNHRDQVRHIFIRRVDGAENSNDRFDSAFAGLTQDLWTIFEQPAEIEALGEGQ